MSTDELYVRVKMADKHIAALKEDIDLFCEEQRPKIKIAKKGSETSVTLLQVDIPIELRVKIGVIAYLLRSSLDHLVWYLVLQNRKTPGRHNQFPISTINNGGVICLPPRTKEMLKGLSPAHDKIIRAFSLDPTIWPFSLLDLHTMCNVDKHRHPHRTCTVLNGLNDNYRRREFQCSEQGQNLPEIGKDDLVIQVYFQDERKVSNAERKLQGEVRGTLEECSSAVQGVLNYILKGIPVGWPFDRTGPRPKAF